MTILSRVLLLAGAGLLLGCLTGCARGPRFTEAEGTVTVNGKPMSNLMVQFMPDGTKEQVGPHSSAITDEKGHFVLKTADGKEGAVVGWHVVTLEDLSVDRPPQGQTAQNPSRIPEAYTTAGRTPLKVEVKEGQLEYPLEVKTRR